MKQHIKAEDISKYDMFFCASHDEIYIVTNIDPSVKLNVSYICFNQKKQMFGMSMISFDSFIYFMNKHNVSHHTVNT